LVRRIELVVLLAGSLTVAGGAAVAAEGRGVSLGKVKGDALGAVELEGKPGDPGVLLVFSADRTKPRHQRFVTSFRKEPGGGLALVASLPLREDLVAYDICRLEGAGAAEALLAIGERGVERLDVPMGKESLAAGGPSGTGGRRRLLDAETVLAHARDDAMPRVRLCFELWRGEPPALIIPKLTGVEVHRQKTPGTFAKVQTLRVRSEAGLLGGTPARRSERERVQRMTLRIEFPDVDAVDFDADGRLDLCLVRSRWLACHKQRADGAYASEPDLRYSFDLLTESEELDGSVRVESRLVELTGDGRPDVVVAKADWKISDMGTTLHVFAQQPDGTFAKAPVQSLERDGFFAFHDYFDVDGDGRLDLVAPVAELGWTEIARTYLTRRANIDFVWYRNDGGRFETKARDVHSVSAPIDLKNYSALLGALPLWSAAMLPKKDGGGTRQMIFFPGQTSVEVREVAQGGAAGSVKWSTEAPVGSETLLVDLDADGTNELVLAYPRDQARSSEVRLVEVK
jgi:hypothetical protein